MKKSSRSGGEKWEEKEGIDESKSNVKRWGKSVNDECSSFAICIGESCNFCANSFHSKETRCSYVPKLLLLENSYRNTRGRWIDLDDRIETRLRKTKRIHTIAKYRATMCSYIVPAFFSSCFRSTWFPSFFFSYFEYSLEIFRLPGFCRISLYEIVSSNSVALKMKRKLFTGDNPLWKIELVSVFLESKIIFVRCLWFMIYLTLPCWGTNL